MATQNITDYFTYLQAPLVNQRWSWGAIRSSDGALFLRVWGDEHIRQDKVRYYRLTAYDVFKDKPDDRGWNERLRHLDLLRTPHRTAPTYLVICTAKDTKAEPRAIADYDKSSLFVGGEVIQANGDWWIAALGRIEAYDARGGE